MKKLIITKDIILSVGDKTQGQEGVLLIKQDAIGGHQVTLNDDNIGNVLLSPDPYTVTVLSYYNDDEHTYWVSSYAPQDSNNALPYKLPFTLK